VSAHRAEFPIATMCRVLGISSSGYYAWTTRTPSRRAQTNAALTKTVRTIHAVSRGTYGAPRVHAELAANGIPASKNRVARLMRNASVVGVSRRKFVVTTVRDGGRQAPDLVDRTFTADAPNVLWVADITYIPTWMGFLYLAVVLDVFSRRIVGWSMSSTLHVTVVLDALSMALTMRRPKGVIHHSDQGSQYTSIAFGNRCREAGVRPSMGSVGDCYDNAMAESFFATLACELLERSRFKTHADARNAVFEFIEGFYNPQRRHSSLGYLSPVAFERQHRGGMCGFPQRTPSCRPCSGPSRPSPRGRAKCAALTAPVRDGVLKVRAGTGGWAPQGPNKRMAPGRRKSREKEDVMTSDVVA
jgi:putative transposase